MSQNGVPKRASPSVAAVMEESREGPVTLRKACCLCVRLKRACDGKDPCHLCIRRRERCTRSVKRKSGPAKGTKYTTRRQKLEAGIIDPIVPPKSRGSKRPSAKSAVIAARSAARAAAGAGGGAASMGSNSSSVGGSNSNPSRKAAGGRNTHATSNPAAAVNASIPAPVSGSDNVGSAGVASGARGRPTTGRDAGPASAPTALSSSGTGARGGRGGRGGRGSRGRGRSSSRGGRGRGASAQSTRTAPAASARFAPGNNSGEISAVGVVDGAPRDLPLASAVAHGRSSESGSGSGGSGPIGVSTTTRVVPRRPVSPLCLPVLPWPSPALPSAMPAAPPPGGGLGMDGDAEHNQVARGRSASPFGLLPGPPSLAGSKPRRGGTREPPVETGGGPGHFWAPPGGLSKRFRMSPPFPSREHLLGGVGSVGQRADEYAALGSAFMGGNQLDHRSSHTTTTGGGNAVISPDGYRLPARSSSEMQRQAADPNELPPGVWPLFSSSRNLLSHPFPPTPSAQAGSSYIAGSHAQAIPVGAGLDTRGSDQAPANDSHESYYHRQQQVHHQDWGYAGPTRVLPPPVTSLAGRSLSLTGGPSGIAEEDDPLLARLAGAVDNDQDHDHVTGTATRWRHGGGSDGSDEHGDENASEVGRWRSAGSGPLLQHQHQVAGGGDVSAARELRMVDADGGVTPSTPSGAWGGDANGDIIPPASSVALSSSHSTHSSGVVGHHHGAGGRGGIDPENVNDNGGGGGSAGWEEFNANASVSGRHDAMSGTVVDGALTSDAPSSIVAQTNMGWVSDHLVGLASSPPCSPPASTKTHASRADAMMKPLLPLPQHLHHHSGHHPQHGRLPQSHGVTSSSAMMDDFAMSPSTRKPGASRGSAVKASAAMSSASKADLNALVVGVEESGTLDAFPGSMAMSSPLDGTASASNNYSSVGDTSSPVWTTPGHVDYSSPPRSNSPSGGYLSNSAGAGPGGHSGEAGGGWGSAGSGQLGGGIGHKGSFVEGGVGAGITHSGTRRSNGMKEAADLGEAEGSSGNVWQPSWDSGGAAELQRLQGSQRSSMSSVGFGREGTAWPAEFSI